MANYYKHTLENFVGLIAAAGIDNPGKLNRNQIYRRVFMDDVKTLKEIYPSIPAASMPGSEIPERCRKWFEASSSEKF